MLSPPRCAWTAAGLQIFHLVASYLRDPFCRGCCGRGLPVKLTYLTWQQWTTPRPDGTETAEMMTAASPWNNSTMDLTVIISVLIIQTRYESGLALSASMFEPRKKSMLHTRNSTNIAAPSYTLAAPSATSSSSKPSSTSAPTQLSQYLHPSHPGKHFVQLGMILDKQEWPDGVQL